MTDRRWTWLCTYILSAAAVAHAQEGEPIRPPLAPPPATEPQDDKPMTPAEAELSAAEFDAWPDLQYADDPDAPPQSQCLDLFTPDENPETPLPVIVWIHGGGWQDGDKRGGLDWKPACFTHAGFVLAMVNYRLAPAFHYPSFMLDAARAVAWLRVHVGEHGGDPDRIVVVGHSAGSHIAGLLATDPHWLVDATAAAGTTATDPSNLSTAPKPSAPPNPSTAPIPPAPQKPPAMQVPWLKGAVLIDGGSYDLVRRAQRQTDAENTIGLVFGRDGSLWSEASPVTHVAAGRNLPPFLLIHAGTNRVNEFARRELAGLLQNAAVPVDLVDAPDQTHVSIQRNLGAPDDPTTAKVVEFLRKVTASPLPPAPRQKTKRRGPY
jgi:arylformamidase